MLIIATCEEWAKGNADLQGLRLAFNEHGINCQLQPWQSILQNPILPTHILPLAVWDYSDNTSLYQSFLVDAVTKGIQLTNTADLQRWNMHKSYLAELAGHGLPVIPSIYLPVDKFASWGDVIKRCHWQNPVLKPLIGQSGKGVRRLDKQQPTLDAYPHGAIIQPFVSSITRHGELCLIYIDGQFCHAIRRTPAGWRANSAHGVEISVIEPKQNCIKLAEQVLEVLPQQPLYARIDLLLDDKGDYIINEVELIEPALYLSKHKSSFTAFVEAVCRKISGEV